MTHDLSSIRYNPQSLGDRAVTGQGDPDPARLDAGGGGGGGRPGETDPIPTLSRCQVNPSRPYPGPARRDGRVKPGRARAIRRGTPEQSDVALPVNARPMSGVSRDLEQLPREPGESNPAPRPGTPPLLTHYDD